MQNTNEPIRIAQIIGKLNVAGVESIINNYYKYLDHDKFQFDYYIDADSNFEPPQELIDMGARYFVIPPYQHLLQHMRVLIRHFRENQYQIVHANMNTLSVFSLCAARIAGVPVRINHNHSTAGNGELVRNIMKYTLRPFAKVFATHYCACSFAAGKWLFGNRAMEKNEVTVFHNAIDLSRFQFDANVRRNIRAELNLDNHYVLGHIGRFCTTKNHEYIILVFQELLKTVPNSILLLIGVGEQMEMIKQQVVAANLGDKVVFLGAKKDVAPYYQAMDAFVFPSLYEGLGLVAIEAQASGLPVICSDRVPEEALVLPQSSRISLEEPTITWAKTIIDRKNDNRQDAILYFDNREYDILKEVKKLQDYYEACIGR